MEKPLSLKREDFVNKMVGAVNECGLPPCVALEVMKAVTAEVEKLAQQQYQKDLAEYEAAEKEEKDAG